MRSLDLFAGIGGFALGFHKAGIETAAFCEINPYAKRVLAKNFPGVPIYEDIHELRGEELRRDVGPIDIVCGGFPCQDISVAGRGGGLGGERSGLWFEMLRVIGEVRPRYVVAENSPALRSRGLDTCLRGLDALGYDAEWHCIPAAAVGSPQLRDRVWLTASSRGSGLEGHGDVPLGIAEEVAPHLRSPRWESPPALLRVDDGVPRRVDRVRCLGNSVVPRIPELIGRALMRHRSADRQRAA